ncbi:hypothetical protein ACQP2P_34540 [Dactylosporangium sp. CA-139114]|uniref:hypothetical protein n=1 Tax=Dactylosporangium sp. CA-139114 TaxID=3239931 RepID=UPI003D954119
MGCLAATGAPVWQRTGYVPVVHGCADGVVVSELYPRGGEAESERQRSTPYLAGIDLRTGAVRWSLVTAPGGISTVVFRSDRRVQVAALDADGTLRLHSGETAEVVRTVRLEDPGTVDGLELSGNRLLAYRAEQRNILEGAVWRPGS